MEHWYVPVWLHLTFLCHPIRSSQSWSFWPLCSPELKPFYSGEHNLLAHLSLIFHDCMTHTFLDVMCVGIWGYLHRAAADHQNRSGVFRQGVHLRLHSGNAAEVGGVRLCQVLHQRLVLAWLPYCRCTYINILFYLTVYLVWTLMDMPFIPCIQTLSSHLMTIPLEYSGWSLQVLWENFGPL